MIEVSALGLGAGATVLGSLLLRYRYETNIVGGVVVIVFGLLMIGMTRRLPWLAHDIRFQSKLGGGHPVAAFVLGIAFGFGWTPCIGPVLGAILTLSAAQTAVSGGIGPLSMYALGLGIPFLLAALFTGTLVDKLRSLRHVGRWLQVAAGAGVSVRMMDAARIRPGPVVRRGGPAAATKEAT